MRRQVKIDRIEFTESLIPKSNFNTHKLSALKKIIFKKKKPLQM